MVEKANSGKLSREVTPQPTGRVADGYNFGGVGDNSPLDLGAGDEAPPAYGDLYDRVHLSQAGFDAGAIVTGEKREPRISPSFDIE